MTDQRAREIFTGATKLPEEERAEFLDEQCGEDAALRAEVEELLARDHGSTKVETEKYSRFDGYQVGETVGPFKIIAHLGEGGFGAVYLAEQTKPVKRRVALKVIKPGMDSKAVLARFDAEQQALALMSHPGIAKVFDAGATPDGRPYFVMEYVKGEPLNEFCDNQKLNTAQRLELFARVCDAIQHAHQKGVIHRDLKPSNILVAIGEHDEPEPKVIDFGIAKATSQQLTEQTIYTQQGQMIGTPEYMSPEQADMRAVDIDIRTDVYSLGVILYELLSGRLPFDPKTLREKGLAEIQRIIREDDPPKPSTRLSTLEEEEGTKIAKARKTQLDALANTLKKELEWIPLRALKKDRRERYGSAEALAQDVRRYLVGEPLEAGPDSRAYRLKKFARRNKGPVITAALVAAALVAGIIGTSIFAVRAEVQRKIAEEKTTEAQEAQAQAEEDAARATAVKDFLKDMLSSVNPAVAGDMDKKLMTLVLKNAAQDIGQAMQDQPLVEVELRQVIGITYLALGMYGDAEPHIIRALELTREHLGEEHPDTLFSIGTMGDLLSRQGKYDEAMPYRAKALEGQRRTLGDEHPDTLISINDMGNLLARQGKYDVAMPYLVEALETQRRVQGDEHPNTLLWIGNMGNLLTRQGKYDDAMEYLIEAIEAQRRTLGDEDPDTLLSILVMGDLLTQQGKYDEAMPYYVEALETHRRVLGDDHPSTLWSIYNMGKLLIRQGKDDEAMPYLAEALDARRRVLGDEHPDTLYSIGTMGYLLSQQGKYDEALPYLAEAIETRRRILGDDHPDTLWSIVNMGDLYERWHEEEPKKGYDAKAAEYRALHEELSGATPAEPTEAAAP